MFNKKSLFSVIMIIVLTISFSSVALAEIEVIENPSWPEEQLGAKPDFSNYKGEKIELTLWHFSQGQIKYLKPFAREFEKLYPEIDLTINLQQMPSDQMWNSLATSLMAGQGAPDITAMEIGQTSRFFVEPFVDQFKEIELSNYLKTDLIKQEPYTANGKLLAVESAGPHPVFMFYRKDLFKEAGIEMPIETWDEFIDAGLKMKKEIGVPITLFPLKNITWGSWMPLSLIVQNSNPIYNENNELIINNEKGQEVFKMIKDMVYKYEIAVDAEPDNPLTQQRLVGSHQDQIASMVAPLWFPGSRLFNKIDDPIFGLAPLPKFDNSSNQTSTWGGTGLSIVESQTEYPDIAEAYIKFVLSSKNQIRKFETTNYLPVVKSALHSNAVINYTLPDVYGEQKVGELYAEYTSELPALNIGPGFASVDAEIRNRMNELAEMDVKEWLDKIVEFQNEL
ncbi:ABC-type glycerol-3-phosphate transport system substrate-binding protein [Halanaerobium saccharolyticum]|uniref:ABC-type glycerol-3-phosphate transport system substrate-binding protein n=1 Tax=Halanaerobium saccharolyticum TaxID=43595 RepID=A0A4R6LYG6_9FIRM|nr:ABC transporter substrate-binding protein [Halanaerobium saccharolyticum]TDO93908.1 ABC-type glycerol-3-phosphate transport system substrate-binding protein [Halanaerobium saccharolyticum]